MKALKYDQGKPRMDLLDPYAMEQLSHVLTFGAQKYDGRGPAAALDYISIIRVLP